MPIDQVSYYANIISLIIIGGCWTVFAATLINRRVSSSSEHSGREPLSWLGLFLQLVSYPISWTAWRSPLFSPFIHEEYSLNIVVQIVAILLGTFSTWLAVAAIRELGKQWSLQARVLEDHMLITTGVYGFVRHPIYTAMLGMLIATGIVISHWLALGVATVVFLAGTKIRIHLEDKLLQTAFGAEFAKWRATVPVLLPYPKNYFRNN